MTRTASPFMPKRSLIGHRQLSELPTIEQGLPFWISCPVPTMTLRWKRALYEACDSWDGDCPEELRVLVPLQEIDSVDENDVEGGDDDVFIEELENFRDRKLKKNPVRMVTKKLVDGVSVFDRWDLNFRTFFS